MRNFFAVYIVCIWAGAANAQICDGRYADATALIDKTYTTYRTLYSGGPGNQNLGPTLEVYRIRTAASPVRRNRCSQKHALLVHIPGTVRALGRHVIRVASRVRITAR